MVDQKFDIVGIGNSIVDVIADINDQYLEEHNIIGGLGSAIADVLSELDHHPKLIKLGISDTYSKGGSYDFLKKSAPKKCRWGRPAYRKPFRPRMITDNMATACRRPHAGGRASQRGA